MTKDEIICSNCDGTGELKDGEVCRDCIGEGTLKRKNLKEITDRESEILRHSPTIDEFVEAYKRKKGLIK
jgi:RecJ-like exonuclease